MTDARMAPAELLEKGPDGDLLRVMIGDVAQRLVQMDVDGLERVADGERGEGIEQASRDHKAGRRTDAVA